MRLGFFGNTYLSIYKHIEDSLTARGFIVAGRAGGITMLEAYPDDDQIKNIKFRHDSTGDANEIILPVLSLEQRQTINAEEIEIGTVTKEIQYPVSVTIFAETSLQNYQIIEAIYETVNKEDIYFYDFDADFDNPVQSGNLYVDQYRVTPLQFINNDVNKSLKWGADISFMLRKLKE